MDSDVYPPIEDYGFIADCHSSALVSKTGSIDWCCMPRVDSKSCFGRILDWEKGGYCQIVPAAGFETSRKYIENTLILETTFRTSDGEVRVFDCFPMRRGGQHNPHRQILRIVEGLRGSVKVDLTVSPRLDYGAVKPWIRKRGDNHFIAIGGSDGLLISGDFPMALKHRHDIAGSCMVSKGERRRISILYRKPEHLDEGLISVPGISELDRRLDETVDWWRAWSSEGRIDGPYEQMVRRSAVVLKGLSNAPTGAIAAAPTTSLPEAFGGSRNWDYRFTWIRDSAFTLRSLWELGYHKEADGFRRFVERSAAGSAEELQILFGVGGERRLTELDIPELDGYRGSKPVRIGNAAEGQMQLDVYGELMDLAWRWHTMGQSPDDDYWEFLVELVNSAARLWHNPDRGIWEMRGRPRHFVHSKAMCWSAINRGVKMAGKLGRQAPLNDWRKACDEIRSAIEEKGYDRKRGIFIQAFELPRMDSALLLLPLSGFVDYRDERMVRTVDAVMEDIYEDGLLRRYAADDDGLEGREGVFLACSFWLAECLARQGRRPEAEAVFNRVVGTGNDLGLFSEEYDTATGRMLGNFPQGLTHLSLITAAVALTAG
ncbi:MAG: glycoside hydrolase family 15 protein [Candidatus Sulfobium sp.]|jgi:GH15 family glucan-1,4-alpha-glucosidase